MVKKSTKKKSLSKKNVLGRPTKYDEKYCQMLIDHMEKGYSFESFAGLIGVCRDTLYEWCKAHQLFFDSKKIAFEKNLLFWERQGIEGLWTSGQTRFNSTSWIFNLKNRFGWVDRKDIDDVNTLEAVTIKLPGEGKAQVISVNKATAHDKSSDSKMKNVTKKKETK